VRKTKLGGGELIDDPGLADPRSRSLAKMEFLQAAGGSSRRIPISSAAADDAGCAEVWSRGEQRESPVLVHLRPGRRRTGMMVAAFRIGARLGIRAGQGGGTNIWSQRTNGEDVERFIAYMMQREAGDALEQSKKIEVAGSRPCFSCWTSWKPVNMMAKANDSLWNWLRRIGHVKRAVKTRRNQAARSVAAARSAAQEQLSRLRSHRR